MDILIIVFIISLLAEYMDASIGMGYGTTLTPILLLMGFSPLQIVPVILIIYSRNICGDFTS